MDKPNEAAADLWDQMFTRQAADPNAAIVDPDAADEDDEARMRAGFAASGWSEAEIDAIVADHHARAASAPTTSPGVNPHVEASYAALCDAVEAAMDRRGMDSHGKVARGIEPRVGPYAAKTGVVMTDQSIVTVGAFLFRFCGLVARAFTRTLRLDPWLWEREDYKLEMGLAALATAPELARYWVTIYTTFALTGTHSGIPFKPCTREEVVLMEQVARAMEIFAIAHEYGHHHLAHGRDISADPRKEEFEADQFALRISDEVEQEPVITENPYLLSGAGGAILLTALGTLRRIGEALGDTQPAGDTHPSPSERIARFDSVRVLMPAEFKWLKGFRTASGRVMDLAHDVVMSGFADIPPDRLARLRSLRDDLRNGQGAEA